MSGCPEKWLIVLGRAVTLMPFTFARRVQSRSGSGVRCSSNENTHMFGGLAASTTPAVAHLLGKRFCAPLAPHSLP